VLLPASTLFTVNITGVKDLAGNNLSSAVTSSFTSGTGADLIRPTITQVDPGNGATGEPTNAVIRLQFSERVNPLTVNNSTFQVFVSGTNTLVTGTISVTSDGLSASFAPSAALAPSTNYFVQVFGITDLTGQEINFFFTGFATGANNASLTKEPRPFEVASHRTK
jgi:hypothetical protein